MTVPGPLVCGVAAAMLASCCAVRAGAAVLPEQLAPAAPFPLVLAQSLEREYVAPGVQRAVYRLQTSAGPLVVSIVQVDPREPSVRFGTVLARDRLVSAGETVSSMAARTGAVAGINADYFDIGNTNAPLGVVAQNGALVRTPSARVALTVARDRSVRFESYHFSGTAVDNGHQTIPIASVNEWPPHDGAGLLTPSYGVPTGAPGVIVDELVPIASPPPGAAPPAGRYRVTQVDSDTPPTGPVFGLALGAAAQAGLTMMPDVGDLIDVALDTQPSLQDIVQAVGGGPALLANGQGVDDPASPGYAERARRIPAAAAARLPDGDVVLVVVDGRRPAVSIGVNRSELIALLAGLGATDAMQFDSGGSATLVARVLGEGAASVQNEPSDGVERPVADGLFVYSDAPPGPPARLVVRPDTIEAMPGVGVPLRADVVDAAGHPLGPARGPWRVVGGDARIGDDDVLQVPDRLGTMQLTLERAGVRAELPVAVVADVARIVIVPDRPDPDPGGRVALRAQAFDAQFRPVLTGTAVRWSALRGSITGDGVFTAGSTDGFVTATVGDTVSSEIVHVGRHQAPLPGFDPASQAEWHFSSVPAGGPGALAFTPQGSLQLSYDFSGTERAAFANAGFPLGEPLALSCAIDGDAGGAGVRVALVDRYGERSALTLAKTVDWTGAQRREVRVPSSLAPPIVLQSFYAVGTLGPLPVKSSGTLDIRACNVTLPGIARQAP